MIINHIKHAIFTKFAAKIRIIFESAKERGENNDYLIIGAGLLSYVMPPLQGYDIMENYIIRHIVIGFFRKLPRPLLT